MKNQFSPQIDYCRTGDKNSCSQYSGNWTHILSTLTQCIYHKSNDCSWHTGAQRPCTDRELRDILGFHMTLTTQQAKGRCVCAFWVFSYGIQVLPQPPTYMDGSKRNGRARGGIVNGNFQAALRVLGEQQVYRAETVAAMIASELAKEGDSIALDNQGATKAIGATGAHCP